MRKLREVIVLVLALAVVAAFSGASVFAGATGESTPTGCACTFDGQNTEKVDADNSVVTTNNACAGLTGRKLRKCNGAKAR